MAIELHQRAFAHAKQLIREGRTVADERGDWRDHRPDADKEDAYMLVMGAQRYGEWHLGIDDEQPEGSKTRYHYLFGDFSDLHRCALFEIEDAADNFFYGDIEIAATALISLLKAHAPKAKAPAAEG
jgi:hypothetical protein